MMFDHSEKAVVRTPFLSALHPQPPEAAPLPLGVAKALAGLVHSGPWGVLRMLLSRG